MLTKLRYGPPQCEVLRAGFPERVCVFIKDRFGRFDTGGGLKTRQARPQWEQPRSHTEFSVNSEGRLPRFSSLAFLLLLSCIACV